jgi:hypothetical protein
MMSQTAATPAAVMATDIAIPVAMSLVHSQVDNRRFQSASLPRAAVERFPQVLTHQRHYGARPTAIVAETYGDKFPTIGNSSSIVRSDFET